MFDQQSKHRLQVRNALAALWPRAQLYGARGDAFLSALNAARSATVATASKDNFDSLRSLEVTLRSELAKMAAHSNHHLYSRLAQLQARLRIRIVAAGGLSLAVTEQLLSRVGALPRLLRDT